MIVRRASERGDKVVAAVAAAAGVAVEVAVAVAVAAAAAATAAVVDAPFPFAEKVTKARRNLLDDVVDGDSGLFNLHLVCAAVCRSTRQQKKKEEKKEIYIY